MKVYDLSEENGLDTYMSIEVPVSEGDEARSPSQEELGQGQEDHGWFSMDQIVLQVSSLKKPKMFLFLDQPIWREEQKSKYDLKKPVEECEDPECRDHAVIRVSQIKNILKR